MQPEARVRIIAWISWLTGRGQQSDFLAPKNPPVRPAGGRFVRLGLHLIALHQFLERGMPPEPGRPLCSPRLARASSPGSAG